MIVNLKENGHLDRRSLGEGGSCPLLEINHGVKNSYSVPKAPTGRPNDSPGQRPGSNNPRKSRALKGRNRGGVA